MTKRGSKLIFRIILPFWIDIPNHSKFQKAYRKLTYEIEVLQDLWQIIYHSKLRKSDFMIPEQGVIDRDFMKPRFNYDDINPLDLSLENLLEIEGNYNVNKLRTVLSIIIKVHEMKKEDDILKYVEKKGIWQDIRNITNYFLSIYTFIRINSDFERHYVHTLGDDYYSNENVAITFKKDSNSKEILLEKAYAGLKIRFQWQHNTVMIDKQSLSYFEERFSKNKNLKLELHERLKILIDYAKKSRDINSLIIYTIIYLERRYIQYLSKMKDMSIESFEILFEKQGLRHFIDTQLPYHLGNEIDSQLIRDTQDLVVKRNEIVHRGTIFVYNEELVEKCSSVLKVIENLEKIIYPDTDQVKFSFKKNLVGVALEVDPSKYVGMMTFESFAEVEYFAKNSILMERINDDFLKKIKLVRLDYAYFELPKSFQGYCKIFNKDNDFKIIFSLNPIHLYMNFKFFEFLIDFLKDKIKPNIIDITFLIVDMPKGTFKLFKKGIEKEIENTKENLDWKTVQYECMMIFKLKDKETKKIFNDLINLFNSKENKSITEEELFEEFKDSNYINLLETFPNLFSKKKFDGQIVWELIKDIKPKFANDT
ncbi:MAG: hypothetical protein ACFFG0_49490 [Candidatus Thorarchaeota archaeon]